MNREIFILARTTTNLPPLDIHIPFDGALALSHHADAADDVWDDHEVWDMVASKISPAHGVLLYLEPEDLQSPRLFAAAGIALGLAKPLGIYAPAVEDVQPALRTFLGMFASHPSVSLCATLDDARAWARTRPARECLQPA